MKSKRLSKKQKEELTPHTEEMRLFAAHKHEHNHQHQLNVSPFPSAIEMEKINHINPTILETMMNTVQMQVTADIQNNTEKINLEKQEQELRKIEVLGEIEHKKRGQNYGLIALIFLGLITLCLVYFEAYKTAAAFATITIIGGTTAFTGFSSKNKKKKTDTDLSTK
jgi:uncharacterized membrane protein